MDLQLVDPQGRAIVYGGEPIVVEAKPVAKASSAVTTQSDAGGYGGEYGARSSAADLDLYWMLYAKHPWVKTCVDLISQAVGAEGFSIQPLAGARRMPTGKATLLGTERGVPYAIATDVVFVPPNASKKAAVVSFMGGSLMLGESPSDRLTRVSAVAKARRNTLATAVTEAAKAEAIALVQVLVDEQRMPVAKAMSIVAKALASSATKKKQDATAKQQRAADPSTPAVGAPTTPNAPLVAEVQDPRMGALHDFFRRAFPGKGMVRVLIETTIDLKVFPAAYWRKKRLNSAANKGSVLFLERLDPRRVTPKPNATRTAFQSFIIKKTNETGVVDPNAVEVLPASEIIMFTMGGGDPLFGAGSPLEALDLTISGDWAIRQHRESYYRNGAQSGIIFSMAEGRTMTDDVQKAIISQFQKQNVGSANAYKPKIVPAKVDIAQVKDAGGTDVDFVKGSEINRDEILAVFNVPPGKITTTKGSGALGLAGKQADDDTFQRDAVLPVERTIYETLTIELLDKEMGITDLVLVPKRMEQLRYDRFGAAIQGTQAGLTGNEARAIMGVGPIDDEFYDMERPLYLGAHQPVSALEGEATGGAETRSQESLDDTKDD